MPNYVANFHHNLYYLECPETVTALHGSPGILVEGVVRPPVPNVTVVVDLGDDGQVVTYTDSSGQYRYVMGMSSQYFLIS